MGLFERVKKLWVREFGKWDAYKRDDVALDPDHATALGPLPAMTELFNLPPRACIGKYVGPTLKEMRYLTVEVAAADGIYKGTALARALSILGERRPKGRVVVYTTYCEGADGPFPLLLARREGAETVGILVAPSLDRRADLRLVLAPAEDILGVAYARKAVRVDLRLPSVFTRVKECLGGWS